MVAAVSAVEAMQRRKVVKNPGTGVEHWRTVFIGPYGVGKILNEPQAFLVEMCGDEVILPHFHEVDQYQIFVSGDGTMGRSPAGALTLHYADHHTGYGPITAGPHGLSYFTLRNKVDPGSRYLHVPGYKDHLKPSRKRHGMQNVALSTEPVLLSRAGVSVEPLLAELDGDDGLGAALYRMGPGAEASGPDPSDCGGYYCLVVGGSVTATGASYPAWSTIFVAPGDGPIALRAETRGAEVMVLRFPKVPS